MDNLDSKKTHRVCIIIPAYNDVPKLARTLESLCAADTTDMEVVVVDDGSHPAIALPDDLYPNYAFRLLRFEKNQGLTKVLNAALQELYKDPPPFIGRLDSGDLVAPSRFSQQLSFLTEQPKVAVVGTWIRFFENENPDRGFFHQPATGDRELIRALDYGNPLIHSSLMIRTDALKQIGSYRNDMRIAQDYDLVRRLSQVGELAILPEVLTFCDLDQGGISVKRRLKQQLYRLKVQLEWFNPLRISSCLGIARTLFAMAIPYSFVTSAKKSRS